MVRLIITLLLWGFALNGWAIPKDKYEKRKKEGIRQLNYLISQNQQNKLKGLTHKNWYIFSDKDPIEEVGMKFFFKDDQLIQKLNKKIREYNERTGFSFYVKLNGLEMVDVEDVLEKMGVGVKKDSLSLDSLANVIRFSAPSAAVYAQTAKTYKNAYDTINRMTEKELAKYLKFESNLTSDIFNASKLGTYGVLLSITGLYYYWYRDEKEAKKVEDEYKENEPGLRVEYEKTIAFGLGFISKKTKELLKIQQDTTNILHHNAHYRQTAILDSKVMTESLTEPPKDNQLITYDENKFMFSVNPDEALKNHIIVIMAFLKENQVVHAAGNDKGYNVIYLINIWDKIPRGKIATKELEQIIIIANGYFDRLKVATRVVLYEGDPKQFEYSTLTQHEGVAFIGAKHEDHTKDFVQAIENLGGDNAVYAAALRKDDKAGDNFEDTEKVVERACIYYRNKFNRVALHYGRMSDRGNQTIMGAGKTKYNPTHEALAFSLIHGVGHNAEKDPKKVLGENEGKSNSELWNHYAVVGVMRKFGGLDNRSIAELIAFSKDTTVSAYKDKIITKTEKIKWYLGGGGGKDENTFIDKDLLPWAYCTLPPQKRRDIIIRHPSYFPNEAYFYSMQDHFGSYKPYTKRLQVRFVKR